MITFILDIKEKRMMPKPIKGLVQYGRRKAAAKAGRHQPNPADPQRAENDTGNTRAACRNKKIQYIQAGKRKI